MSSDNTKTTSANASIIEIEQSEEYREWLAFAQIDYECADYLNKAPLNPKPLNVVCYHCQQAAEKAIKGLIIYFGKQGGAPKVHDLTFLLEQVKNIAQSQKGAIVTRDLMTMADGLSKYGVASRYPNEIDVDEFRVAKALRDSLTLVEWVRQTIEAPFVKDGVEK